MFWLAPFENFIPTRIRQGDLISMVRTRHRLEVYVTLWRELDVEELRQLTKYRVANGRRERLLIDDSYRMGLTVRLRSCEPAMNSVMRELGVRHPELLLFDWRPKSCIPGLWLWRTYVAI